MKEFLSLCVTILQSFFLFGQVPWVDCNDLSRGTERHAVPVCSPLAGPCYMLPFTYVTKSVFSERVVVENALESMCSCRGRNCFGEFSHCECAMKNGGRFAYTEGRRLAPHMLQQVGSESFGIMICLVMLGEFALMS
jgi:hypothetical protein